MRSNNVTEKATKTVFLLGVLNLCMAPLLSNSSTGLLLMMIVNGSVITHLHSLGKKRRPASNALAAANSLFMDKADRELNEIENAFRNIINGGAAVHDDVLAVVFRRR